MTDHLIDSGNLKDLGIALIVGLALAALVAMVSGCSPQQMGSTMPLMSMGTSMTSQAASLLFEQQQMEQQAAMQRQQQQLQLEQLRANQR